MNALYAEHPAMFKNHPIGFLVSILLIPVFGVDILGLAPRDLIFSRAG